MISNEQVSNQGGLTLTGLSCHGTVYSRAGSKVT